MCHLTVLVSSCKRQCKQDGEGHFERVEAGCSVASLEEEEASQDEEGTNQHTMIINVVQLQTIVLQSDL